jgi:hypothetical protein
MGIGQVSFAQYIYTIKADSVKITNSCDTAELIIENHTQNVPGFLYNKGKGRTEFRRAAIKLNDTTYIIGGDTIKTMPPGIDWLISGNSNINDGINFLGTTNQASVVIKTNNIERARVTGNTGNVLVGDLIDNGAKLQVKGKQTINGTEDVTQLAIKLPASASINTPIVQIQDNAGASLLDLRVDSTSIFLGAQSGNFNAGRANGNIALGRKALASNTTGAWNFAGCSSCLANNTTGSNNLAIGGGGPALYSNTTGSNNTAIGNDALASNTVGSNNVAIGKIPMKYNVDGINNVAIGGGALAYNVNGNNNVAVGGAAMAASLSGTSTSQNVAIGVFCAQQQQLGVNNVFMGYRTNFSFGIGDNNTVIGANSNVVTGSNNILLGASSRMENVSNTTIIGQGISNCQLSNLVVLGRADQNTLVGATNSFSDNGARLQVNGSQTTSANLGVGGVTFMTAKVHIAASDGSTGTAPVKLTAGAILTTPENGAIEFDGTDVYITENASRYKLAKTIGGQITTNFGGTALSAFSAFTTTLTVTGAQPGDVVNVSANSGAVNPPSIIVTAYVTSANTVTLQAYNASGSAVTIATDTYKVRVIK